MKKRIRISLKLFLKVSEKGHCGDNKIDLMDLSRHYYLILTYLFNILPTLACKVTTFGSQSRIRQVPHVGEQVTVVIKSSLSLP